MAAALASIEKLYGENYSTWCIQIRSLLITMDLWHTILEECPKENALQWLTTDNKALATITLSLKSSELIYMYKELCYSKRCMENIGFNL